MTIEIPEGQKLFVWDNPAGVYLIIAKDDDEAFRKAMTVRIAREREFDFKHQLETEEAVVHEAYESFCRNDNIIEVDGGIVTEAPYPGPIPEDD